MNISSTFTPITRGVEQVNVAIVKTNAQDLRSLLKEANFTDRKAFLRSPIKRIEVTEKQLTVYTISLLMPPYQTVILSW